MKSIVANETISIVVPVYNTEAYLDECIGSLTAQTYPNLEILLINDGTKDDSLTICRRWQEKDPRIKIYDNTNHGVSYTRNFGIEHCTGEYVTFVDSDDAIAPNYVETLYDLIKKNNCELSAVTYCCFQDGGPPQYQNSEDTLLKKDGIEELFYTVSNGFVWSKMYKTELLKKHHVAFDSSIAICEDMLFNFYFARHCTAAAFSPAKLYGYRQRAGSAIHNTVSPKWFSCLTAYRILFEDFSHTTAFPHIVFFYLKHLYEAKYLITRKGVSAPVSGADVRARIKTAEKQLHLLSMKRRCKLLICKYLFSIVEKRRK